MGLSQSDIDAGLDLLGLSDESVRHSLSQLAQQSAKEPAKFVETTTTAHTQVDAKDDSDAELERNPQRS